MDGKMDSIVTGFAPLDFLNAMVYPSIREPIEKIWDEIVVNDVEKAKDKGLEGIYELAKGKLFNEEKYGNYEYSIIDTEILAKLLKGNINSLKALTDLQESQLIKNNYDKSLFVFTVLYYTIKEKDNDHNVTYIDSIFIND